MVVWIADISNHKPGFDVPRAVAEGYQAVIMKCTEGVGTPDVLFDTFAPQVVAAGAIPGAYHFLWSGRADKQAEVFHRRIVDHGGPDGWITALDTEADAGFEDIAEFADRWAELTDGHPLMIYSSDWWWPDGWKAAHITPYLWDSRYVSGSGFGSQLYAGVPESWWTPRYGGWSTTTILQFSDRATVAGHTPVDVNAYRGTLDDLRILTTRGGDMAASPLSDADIRRLAQNIVSGITRGSWELGFCDQTFDQPFRDATKDGRTLQGVLDAIHGLRDAIAAVHARLDQMEAGVVDVEDLAARLVPLLPSADGVAERVVDVAASRLAL